QGVAPRDTPPARARVRCRRGLRRGVETGGLGADVGGGVHPGGVCRNVVVDVGGGTAVSVVGDDVGAITRGDAGAPLSRLLGHHGRAGTGAGRVQLVSGDVGHVVA